VANSVSDCKYAQGEPDPSGMFWCEVLGRTVSGAERPTCDHYEKG
jgi:hypothetical protein